MQFKYYNILWMFLCLIGFILLFMPKREEAKKIEANTERIPQNEKNGPILSYSESGVLKTKVTYTNGVKNGLSYLFYGDGKTVQLEMSYVDGKREGISRKYYENGNIYAETSYKNNQLNGIRKLYFTTGQLKAEIPYQANNPGTGLIEYLLNGEIKTTNSISLEHKGEKVNLNTVEPCRELKFYIGKLIDDQFFNALDQNIRLLPNEGSQFFVELNTSNKRLLESQYVICSCKTRQGNPLILKRRIDASSLKNVNQ